MSTRLDWWDTRLTTVGLPYITARHAAELLTTADQIVDCRIMVDEPPIDRVREAAGRTEAALEIVAPLLYQPENDLSRHRLASVGKAYGMVDEALAAPLPETGFRALTTALSFAGLATMDGSEPEPGWFMDFPLTRRKRWAFGHLSMIEAARELSRVVELASPSAEEQSWARFLLRYLETAL